LFEQKARELGLPLRRTPLGVRFCGDFYGHDGRGRPDPDAITLSALIQLLERTSEGVTELGCHPGYADDLNDWYRAEREQEVRVLCDPRLRTALRQLGIALMSFSELVQLQSSRVT
jgi:predicted glycoside hydrolase/deacetylase ChbG (UPF0249 family)